MLSNIIEYILMLSIFNIHYFLLNFKVKTQISELNKNIGKIYFNHILHIFYIIDRAFIYVIRYIHTHIHIYTTIVISQLR